MAKEKTVSPEVENLVSPEAEEAAVKEEAEDKKEVKEAESNPTADDGRVEYIVPMNVFGDGDYVTVGLNGVNFQIEVGVPVRVPKGVKEILDESIRRKKEASGKAKKMISGDA